MPCCLRSRANAIGTLLSGSMLLPNEITARVMACSESCESKPRPTRRSAAPRFLDVYLDLDDAGIGGETEGCDLFGEALHQHGEPCST